MAEQTKVLTELDSVLTKLKLLLIEANDMFTVDLQGYIGAEMFDNKNPTYPTGREELQNVSGRLFASFGKSPHNADDAINEVVLEGYTLKGEFGSAVPYAHIHETGGKAGRNLEVEIPARKYFSNALENFETSEENEKIQELRNRIIQILYLLGN